MADSLDDFFAKKDKKRKNKSQSAALSASALVRELEEGAKQSDYSARREGKTSAAMEILGLDSNDNDWKDFEEVEKRDYTGLKVKEMSIQDQDEEQRRLTEQSEQVPETIPWKSKEDTVAALLSAKTDSNQLATDLMDQSESVNQSTTQATTETTVQPAEATSTTTATTTTTTDPKSSESDDKESDANQAAKATTQPDDKESAGAKDESKQGDKEATSNSSADAPKKDGDSEPPVVAKKVYVPPMQRLEKEQTTLQPIKGGLLKGTGSRRVAQINLDSKQEFPGLG